jgi:hypothetical protein
MTGLQILIAIVGVGVTALVGFGMILLAPRYTVDVSAEAEPPNLSAVPAAEASRETVAGSSRG